MISSDDNKNQLSANEDETVIKKTEEKFETFNSSQADNIDSFIKPHFQSGHVSLMKQYKNKKVNEDITQQILSPRMDDLELIQYKKISINLKEKDKNDEKVETVKLNSFSSKI